MRGSLLCLGAGVAGAFLAGCTPNYPDTARVSGVVTLNKQPLDSGEIQFIGDNGVPAMGRIEPGGTYRLSTFLPDDGALPGTYRVIIRPAPGFLPSGPSALIAIPKRYADPVTSGLTAQVNEGINLINFDLQADDQVAEGGSTRF